MPAEVLELHEQGLQSQDADKNLQVLQYCLVLVSEYESSGQEVGDAVLWQKTGAVVQVQLGYDGKLVLNMVLH